MSDQDVISPPQSEFEDEDDEEGDAPQLTDDEEQEPVQHKPSLSNPDHGQAAAAALVEALLTGGGGTPEEEDGENDAGSGSDDEDADEAPEDEPDIEDEQVTEQRRVDKEKHMEEMTSIETEYAVLKDKLFQQRLSRVDDSLRRLKQGRLSRFKHQQEAIETERKSRLDIANVRRALRENNHAEVKGAAVQGANADFIERSRNLKADLTERLKTEIDQADKNKGLMDVKFTPEMERAGKLPMYNRRNPATQRNAAKRQYPEDTGYVEQRQREQQQQQQQQQQQLQQQPYQPGFPTIHTSPPQHPGPVSKRPRTGASISRVPVLVYGLEDGEIQEDIYTMGGGNGGVEYVNENDDEEYFS